MTLRVMAAVDGNQGNERFFFGIGYFKLNTTYVICTYCIEDFA